MFGHLQTVFSVLQLIGGPVYGRIGDLYGERTALLIAFTSSFLTYTMTFLSYSVPILFISRIPSMFLHVMQGSQMVMTGLSTADDRATALARLGFSYGVGMVIGPTLGGQVIILFMYQWIMLYSYHRKVYFQSRKRLYNHKCCPSVCLSVCNQNPTTAWNPHTSLELVDESQKYVLIVSD